MNKEELKKILPHREPMLLLDECFLSDDGAAYGKYYVRGDEFFLKGHFPNNPVVPGVILCEIMAQSSCMLLDDKMSGATPYYTSISNARFKRKVLPGDTLNIKSECVRVKEPFYFIKSEASVNGELAVSGEFSFALINNDK